MYITVTEADNYISTRPYSDSWPDDSSAGEAEKELYLEAATHMLNNYVQWHGVKTSSDQENEWPRMYVRDRQGFLIDSDTIPQCLKYATVELALALMDHDLLQVTPNNISQIDLLSLSVNLSKSSTVIPDRVWLLISHLGARIGDRATIKVTR
jgi:hypothetical protein